MTEGTTGRAEWFLANQSKVSPSQGKQSRKMLNMLFGYALGHDAIARNPVEGTSRLRRAKATPRALATDRIAATGEAAAKVTERTRFTRAKRDGQVRGIIEDLLSSAMPRPTAQGPCCRACAGTRAVEVLAGRLWLWIRFYEFDSTA